MHDEPLWLQPDYFEGFRCKCGECRSCCCDGWDIAVSREEYFRLIGMECSGELHHKLECAFRVPEEPSPERFRLISPNWLGECPMRDGDGLCLLQKECGAENLPEICRVYPRSLKKEGEMLQACCSNACEAVVEALMAEDKLRFTFAPLHAHPEFSEGADVQALMMGRVCIEILQDRSLPLRERIAGICRMLGGEDGEAGSVEAGLSTMLGILRKLESASLDRFTGGICDHFSVPEEYLECARKFENRFPDWERWFENILINHMVYMGFPGVDKRLSRRDALKGLCGAWALLRLTGAHYAAEKGSEADFVDAASGVFRLVEHSAFYYNSKILIEDFWPLLSL
ncbi:MAG: flagellin lysine-N-methylase [Clostridia bacterium]|nr:flagellin lysine-N-methylase [Clostridia bacterium]